MSFKGLQLADTAFLRRGGVVGPSSPSDLTGLVRWYKADTYALADGDAVGGAGREWIDQSPSLENAIQGTIGSRPTYQTNSFGTMPAIKFVGASNQFLTMTGVVFTGELTIIAIVGYVAGDSIFYGHSSNIWFRQHSAITTLDSNMGGVVVPSSAYTGNPDVNGANMWSWRRDLAAVMSFRESASSLGDVADGAGLVTATFTIIGGTTGAGASNCRIGEFCVYTTRQTDANIDALYLNYFKPRWGLP